MMIRHSFQKHLLKNKIRCIRFYFACILILFFIAEIKAQSPIQATFYSVEEGLSQRGIENIIQDNNGLIWISTRNGLERFDGYSFTNYKTYPDSEVRIANHRFTQIKKSSLNNIWCITYDGHCYLFNTQKYLYEDLHLYNNSFTNNIIAIYPLDYGITWLLGASGDLYRINENILPLPEAVQLFNNKNTIGNTIYNITQDNEGKEWVLTDKGTSVFGSEEIVNHIQFQYITENKYGIFLATGKGFFARYDNNTGEAMPCAPNFSISQINDLFSLNNGDIAIVHKGAAIIIYHPQNNTFERYPIKIDKNTLSYQDKDSVIWLLGEKSGVIRFDYRKRTWKEGISYPLIEKNFFDSDDRFIFEDQFGTLWIKPTDGEFCYYDTSSQQLEQAYTYSEGKKKLLEIRTNSFLIDQQHNLWYNDNGLHYLYFNPQNIRYIPNQHNANGRSIMEDHLQRLWVGWKSNLKDMKGYICLYDSLENRIGNVSKDGVITADENVRFDADVYCIIEDRNKNIWIGTKKSGLYLLKYVDKFHYRVQHYTHDKNDSNSLSSNLIYSILEDSKGHIWIGTFGGGINLVQQNSQGLITHFIHSNNQLNNFSIHNCHEVRCLYETSDGIICIGTTNGLLTFSSDFSRPEMIYFYHNTCDENNYSLSNNDILNIFQSHNGEIYITTQSGGINEVNDQNLLSGHINFKHHDATNSRISDVSLTVIEDLDHNLWIESEDKISKFNADMQFIDEFYLQQMTESTPIIRKSGKLIFGSRFGIYSIDPRNDKKNDYDAPPIVFLDMDIYSKDTTRHHIIFNNKDIQTLKADERNFMISFSALDYKNQHSIEYAYRIVGLNGQWIHSGKSHSATITNIPAGDFRFEVKSTNANGVWADNITSLPIHVNPHFSETVWALILYILLGCFVLLAIIIIAIRISQLRRRVDMEQQLANLKLRFFTDISHELRTPLTLISSPIEELASHKNRSNEDKENIYLAQRNIDRMKRLVNQILDFRKIQNGKMKVFIEKTDVIPLIKKTFDSFVPMANKQDIHFELSCPTNQFDIYTDVDKLEKIIFNLLSNAFKYTSNRKNIRMEVKTSNSTLFFSVQDEGRGISSEKMSQLFTRFETADEANPSISTGIGLSLVKELLGLLHGSIKVDSTVGKGSTFSVKLPGDINVFEKDKNAEFILKDDDRKNVSPKQIEKEKEIEDNNGKNIRILIIEDNGELRVFIKNILKKEYEVYEAANGKEGLDLSTEILPDMVISDIMMPEMDGIEYLKAVRANHNICHIPIILLSAKSSLDDQIQGLEHGADDYITKPFSASYLKTKIATMLKQRQTLYDFYTSSMGNNNKPSPNSESIQSISPSVPALTHFDEDFIKMLVSTVEENFQNPDFRIEDLAESINMSRTVFYRKIKSLVGLAPVDFVKKMRIQRAIQLIDQGSGRSISEIGYMSGFSTPQYFTRVFKEIMHCTPKEYQQKKS